MNDLKVGHELTFNQVFEVTTALSKDKVTISPGDKAVVIRSNKQGKGIIKFTTGKAKGKIQLLQETVNGYDYTSMSRVIVEDILKQTDEEVEDPESLVEILEEWLLELITKEG